MGLLRKKQSIIDRRLNELRKEMVRLNSEVKVVSQSRALRNLEAVSQLRRRALLKDKQNKAQTKVKEQVQTEPSSDNTFGKQSLVAVAPETELLASAVEADAANDSFQEGSRFSSLYDTGGRSQEGGREKFANYFTAGHFQNLRPLRQENRILRNKTIMMVILVILAAFWLFCFLGRE